MTSGEAHATNSPSPQCQPCTRCLPAIKSLLCEFGSVGGHGVGCFRGSIPLPWFSLWGRRSQASGKWLETIPLLLLARAWQRPLVTQAGWGDIVPKTGGSLLLPSAAPLGVQPIQKHCSTRLAKSAAETAPWLPACYPVMYSTGMDVQHPSTTPSISRQHCKHSLVNSLSHLLHLSSPVTVNKQKI